MPHARLLIAACLTITACAARPAWDVKGAGLKSLAGGDLVKACKTGTAEDCFALASKLEAVNASEPEQRAAIYHLHLEACEQNHPGACERLGYEHAYGRGPNLDPARTQAALVAACEVGQAGACHVAGSTLDEGRLGEPDEAGAYHLFLQGCEQDDPRSCAWVGLKLEFGRGAPQDRGKAFAFFDKACGLGEHAVGCFNVAMHMLDAPEDEQDLDRIVELMQLSCEAGTEVACENVAILTAPPEPAPVEDAEVAPE